MTEQKAFVFIPEAARLAKVSRRTVDRDIQSGKIHQTQIRNDKHRKKIAVAELERVYGQLETLTKTDKEQSPNLSQSEYQSEKDMLAFYKQELERERERTRKAEDSAKRWEERFLDVQAKLNAFLLPPPKKKGVFSRIFGTK